MIERHDHIEWSDEKLFDETMRLGEQLRQPWMQGERRQQISRALGRVTFEQMARYVERHPEAIELQAAEQPGSPAA